MSGLLVKDFRLMLQRKRFFLLLLGIVFCMAFTMVDNMAMIVGYLTIISVLFCSSSMSYDEYDNCYAFLMTLPVERKTYVWEKYIFGLLIGVGAWGISLAVCCLGRMAQVQILPSGEEIVGTLSFILLGLLALDLIIPFQLKYGMERGRIVQVAAMGAIVLVAILSDKLAESMGIDLGGILSGTLEGAGEGMLIAVTIAVVILLTGISVLTSRRIMEKKEF